ncbi:hypothetical protein NQ317_002287 [Molorchus minor]|uniref:SCP domain-containing protein n=1 Tax=Molorchus minor TaxID=1323400 RepID=A0ABQ9J6C6_9CUCU|nr:hypothetical protein NQ317_002287 [Molorchus minor]
MDFQLECLQAHNEYRKKHGVPPLKLNKEMCRVSQEWANRLIRTNVLQHSNNREYGENLFCIQSSNPNFSISGKDAVDNWYEEIKVHKFGVEPNSLASGHFTQVVWKDSHELGVAYAKSAGKIVVVANYSPAGNIIGHFAENVPPPGAININNNIELSNDISKLSINPTKTFHKSDQKVTEGNFEEDFLEAHNTFRKRHGVPPLKLDRKLCRYSEEWAKHLAAKNILEHRPGSNYGENIYCLYSSDPNFTVNGHTPVDTCEYLGVGVAKNSQGSIYVVANYSPAGNFVGHYVENVPPVKPAFYGDVVRKKESPVTSPETPREEVGGCGGQFSQFALDALKVHNEYRKKHGVSDLELSQKNCIYLFQLCKFAQEWADTCARTSSLQHRANCPYGENIFSVYSSDFSHTPTARDAVKEWYDEIKQHTFGMEKVNQNTLHFTQVVWKNSKQLGIGIAKNKRGQTYVVANYDPRGNYIGQFVDNVPRSKA